MTTDTLLIVIFIAIAIAGNSVKSRMRGIHLTPEAFVALTVKSQGLVLRKPRRRSFSTDQAGGTYTTRLHNRSRRSGSSVRV